MRLRRRVSIAMYAVALFIFAALVTGSLETKSLAYPRALVPSTGALFGAFAGPRGDETSRAAVLRLESQVGRKLAIDHQYYKWDQPIPTGHQVWDAATGRLPFVNWNAQKTDGSAVSWSAIAEGSQDGWIIQRTEAFKSFGSPIYVTFHHEPENDLTRFGTPDDYVAAFRHIVTLFRDQGVTNVAFVWTMMNWTFDPQSGRDPSAYYPGDDYVDIIGSDGYNWYPGRPGAVWESFQQLFENTNLFAVVHNKPWMAVETGVQEDPLQPGRKGQWFRDIVTTAEGWPLLKAVIYFDTIKEFAPNSWNSDSSVSSIEGFTALALDPYLRPPSNPRPPTLRNSLNLGPDDAPIRSRQAGAGDAFSQVTTTGGSTVTYDDRHAIGKFSARHTLTSGGNAYYQWTGVRSIWYGRVYVWLRSWPPSDLRLIRGSANGVLRCALDIMPNGVLTWVDQFNNPIVSTTTPIAVRKWVRIEWKIDHVAGSATIKLFNRRKSSAQTESVTSATGNAIGPSAQEIQYGRTGSQPFTITFWTDRPALSSSKYLATT